ncbi:MAG: metal-dependent hydrolase [archaeon]
MMFKTHLAFSLLIGLLIYKIFTLTSFNLNPVFFFMLLLIGAGFPDIDMPKSKFGRKIRPLSDILYFVFGHRKFMHSFFFLVLISGLIYVLAGIYFLAFAIGFLTHVLLDGFSKEGINFFYPIKSEIKGPIRTNSFLEKLLFYGLVFVDVIIIYFILRW